MSMQDARSTVLLVEDDELLRLYISEELADADIKVLEARSADDAWALFQNEPSITAVVTDLNLRGERSGADLCDQVRAARPETRLVIASGERVHPGQVPGAAILAKPYNGADVIELVQIR